MGGGFEYTVNDGKLFWVSVFVLFFSLLYALLKWWTDLYTTEHKKKLLGTFKEDNIKVLNKHNCNVNTDILDRYFGRERTIEKTSGGTYANIVDLVLVYVAHSDWRSTLRIRILSKRYKSHPSVIRAICWVPARIAMEHTFLNPIQRLRNEHPMDPETLDVYISCFGNSLDDLNLFKIPVIGFTHRNPSVDQLYYFDTSSYRPPHIERYGPCTISLFDLRREKWFTFDFKTHIHDNDTFFRTFKRIVTTHNHKSYRCLFYAPNNDKFFVDMPACECPMLQGVK